MLSKNFVDALRIISDRLSANRIAWALCGSSNLALQAMDVSPHDIDIYLQLKDLQKVHDLFPDFIALEMKQLEFDPDEPGSDEPVWELQVVIGDVDVQFYGASDSGVYVSKLLAKRIVNIKKEGMVVPCLSLEAEAQAYSEIGCETKADKVRDFIASAGKDAKDSLVRKKK